MYGLAGPRYGAWSLLDAQQPSALQIAQQSAQGWGNVAGTFDRNNLMSQQLAQNQQMLPGLLQNNALKNSVLGNTVNYQNQTMPGAIQAANAQNATTTQYDPLEARAKWQSVLDSNNNITARTGLINQKITQGNQPPDVSGGFNALYSAYKTAPPGSPQSQYYGGLLNKLVATNVGSYMPQVQQPQQGIPPTQGGAPSPQIPQPVSSNGLLNNPAVTGGYTVNPGSISARSMRGAQYSVQNPDGTVSTFESPTTATSSQAQKRTMAGGEVHSLGDVYTNGVMPYMGAGGGLGLLSDYVKTYAGDPDATSRLTAYTQSQNLKPELAQAINRFATNGQGSVEGTKSIENSALSNHWLTPQAAAQGALENYLATQKAAFNQSVSPERTGFQQNVDGTNWLGSQANNQPLFTDQLNGQQAAPPQSSAPAQQPSMVNVVDPQGKMRMIPANMLDAALKAGGKRG